MQRPHLIRSLAVSVLAWIAAASSAAADSRTVPAFPGAQGFGAYTPGGRGGKILRVTTLNSKGPGSFVEALQTKGPRIIVFEVGGVIDLEGKSLRITEPFLTIAGQTAPAPGVTIIKGEFNLRTHDVIIQHIAVRPGEAGRAKKSGWEADGIGTWGAFNVIVDHCSCTWATDENLSASGQRFEGKTVEDWRRNTSHHVTFSNCIIAEGLSQSTHGKGEHSKGSLIHDNANSIAIIGNLYASNVERNPLAKGGVQMAIVNNWIANPGRKAVHHHLVPSEWGSHPFVTSRLAAVGNVMELGSDSRPDIAFLNNSSGPLELYLKDNLAVNRDHQPAPMTAGTFTRLEQAPLWPEGLTPLPAEKVKDYVAKNVGARPWDRDPIDQRIVRAALAGTGKIINSEQEAGGYPIRPATSAPFKPEEWNLETLTPLHPPGQKAGL
jgi:hypothetical protein